MSQNEMLRVKNQICHPIYSASNALMRIYKPLLEPLKLTYPQYLIMMTLWEQDGINIQAISESIYFDSGTLTPLIQKLKKTGYIELTANPKDNRNKIVKLTKSGLQLKQKAKSIPQDMGCLIPFKMQETKQLKQMIETLYQSLINYEKSSKKI